MRPPPPLCPADFEEIPSAFRAPNVDDWPARPHVWENSLESDKRRSDVHCHCLVEMLKRKIIDGTE
jgi:hypothetical protein